MAKKKTKKKNARDPEQTRRVVMTSIAVISTAALGAGVVIGNTALDQRADDIMSAPLLEIEIEWPLLASGGGVQSGASTWLPPSERERLTAIAQSAAAGGSSLDVAPLREVSTALARTGWFAEAPGVRRRGDGSLIVEGRWRVPAAVIRDAEREQLVSWSAIPLPISYAAGQSGQRYLANATFAQSDEVTGLGAPAWPGDDVAAGLSLLRLLGKHDLLDQVAGIDLNGSAADVRLTIVTDRGSRIVWGAGPRQSRPAEMPAEVKIDRLIKNRRQSGHIDLGVQIVEIHGPQILVQRSPAGG